MLTWHNVRTGANRRFTKGGKGRNVAPQRHWHLAHIALKPPFYSIFRLLVVLSYSVFEFVPKNAGPAVKGFKLKRGRSASLPPPPPIVFSVD